MEVKHSRSKTAYRIFWGILFLLAGIAIVLNLAGVPIIPHGVSAGDAIWTTVLALVFIWSLLHRFWFFTFFSLLGIGYVWHAELGLEGKAIWPFAGAALLLSIGFSLLFRTKKKCTYAPFTYYTNIGSCNAEHVSAEPDNAECGNAGCGNATCGSATYESTESGSAKSGNTESGNAEHARNASEAQNSQEAKQSEASGRDTSGGGFYTTYSDNDDNVYIKASFGSTIKYVNANALKRANLDCSFGSIKVFFDNTKIGDGGATINIDNSFGGIELYIPKEWHLIDNVSRILGGVDIKNPEIERGTGPIVTLTGNVKFGGVEIVLV